MSKNFGQRGGWWVVGQFILMFAVTVLGFSGRAESRHSFLLCGLTLFALAALCGISGVMALGRNLTAFPKPTDNTQLVQSGIYGLMRHPLYTAVICAAAGWSLLCSSWPAGLASLALAVFLDAKARREERWLRERFPDYRGYEQRVRRFIPSIY